MTGVVTTTTLAGNGGEVESVCGRVVAYRDLLLTLRDAVCIQLLRRRPIRR